MTEPVEGAVNPPPPKASPPLRISYRKTGSGWVAVIVDSDGGEVVASHPFPSRAKAKAAWEGR